jgi:histidine ammonia-lyase
MIAIDGTSLSVGDVADAALHYARVGIADKARAAIGASRRYVQTILDKNETVYGITTGVGKLATTTISPGDAAELQINLIRSHSTNVGPALPEEVVRAMMLLRANALAKGLSGIRLEVVELLIEMLNSGVYPYIPSQGSVGASGDLSPLSHLALVMIGEGECLVEGSRHPSKDVLRNHGLEPVALQAKEGLALINGTQVMAAYGALTIYRAKLLLKYAQIGASMAIEAMEASHRQFDEKIHAARPHPGQIRVAANMRRLLAGSQIVEDHKDCGRVQDAYSLRCIPQVYGAVADAVSHTERVLAIEINSATDNPLIFPDANDVISGGNFHGEPIALVLDYLGIALAELASIQERTIERLVNPALSNGLPGFLTPSSGLHSGFMISQYTAAALVSENKVLAHPASVDSIPTSASQEDHVSMGSIGARHAYDILENLDNVTAIFLLSAAQGLGFKDSKPGAGAKAALEAIRSVISHQTIDRIMYKQIAAMRDLMAKGDLLGAVEAVAPLD